MKAPAFLTTGALVLLHSARVLAQQTDQPPAHPWGWYGPGHMMWGFGWGFWWMMPLMMLFFFLVCALVMWLLFGRMWRGGAHHWGTPWHMMGGPEGSWRDPTQSALRILHERYAKGDIDKAEYADRKAVILTSREH